MLDDPGVYSNGFKILYYSSHLYPGEVLLVGPKIVKIYLKHWIHLSAGETLGYQTLGIQLYSQLMIGVSNHLLISIVFRFHYHSQKVIGSLGKEINNNLGIQETSHISMDWNGPKNPCPLKSGVILRTYNNTPCYTPAKNRFIHPSIQVSQSLILRGICFHGSRNQ